LLSVLLSLNFCSAFSFYEANGFGVLRLAVYVSPPVLLADGNGHRCVYVQIQDLDGKPSMAPSNVTVTLTSSNLDVGVVENPIVIAEGESFSIARFNTTLKSGVTVITASASGFITGSATLTTVNPYAAASPPFRLRVYASPSVMPAERARTGTLSVQLTDSTGTPLLAFSDINVTLTSSNTTVLSVPLFATIPSGTSYTHVSFTVLGVTGKATITALAKEFIPGNVTVSTVKPGGKPAKLALTLNPPILLPDNSVHTPVAIQLLDVNGNPTKAEEDVQVYLSSSNVEVGTVTETVTIKRGEYYSLTRFKTEFRVGETVIAASAQGLEAATATLEVRGFTPSKLSVYTAPPTILADGRPKDVVAVQVQAENGVPIASARNIKVHLTSSSTSVGQVPVTATIEKGESYVVVPFTPTVYPGDTNVTASAQGLEAATATITTVTLPLNLTIEAPSAVRINQTFTVNIAVTSDGYPVQNATVKWTVIGGEILAKENVTDENGNAYLTLKQTSETLRLTVQATKLGYWRAEASKSIEAKTPKPPSPLTVNILGFEIPLLTIMIITAGIVAALLCIYLYLRARHVG